MMPPPSPIILRNLFAMVETPEAIAWQPFREGVEVHWLSPVQDGRGPSTALLRFQPGASVPLHEHPGFEHILLLAGSQSDENGLHELGALVVHPPGTRHRVTSAEGCIVLAIYELPVEFINPDSYD